MALTPPIPPSPEELRQIDSIAQDMADLPAWMTLIVAPGGIHREWRFKCFQSVTQIRDVLRRFSPRLYRFTAARFADASVVISIVPADAPTSGPTPTEQAKGK